MADLYPYINELLGLSEEGKDLSFSQMAYRTVVVFGVAVLVARLADRRMLGRLAGFDFIVGVVLGSVISRGINGDAQLLPTLGASVLLVLLHRILSAAAYQWHWVSRTVKGDDRILVENGRPNHEELRRNHITDDDLCENLRLHGAVRRPEEVAEARLERDGRISVIRNRDIGSGVSAADTRES